MITLHFLLNEHVETYLKLNKIACYVYFVILFFYFTPIDKVSALKGYYKDSAMWKEHSLKLTDLLCYVMHISNSRIVNKLIFNNFVIKSYQLLNKE